MSGWCGAPTNGSFDRYTSPGAMPGFSDRFSSVHFTLSEWLFEKYCRFGPRNTSSPSSVSTDVWKSRVSIVIGDTQRRWMSAECSRFTCSSA